MTPSSASSLPQELLQRLAEIEQELAAVKQELEHSQRLATIGTLAAGIAHEVNNILTPVLSYAAMARSRPEDELLTAKALEKTITGVQAASRIAQAMLGFAGTEDDHQLSNINEVLDEALACLARDPSKDRITIERRIEIGTCVCMRPLSLQQVFVNLILNAIHALAGKGGMIRIEARQQIDGQTVLTLTDDGPGFPPSIAGSLFQPFVTTRRGGRGDKTRSRAAGGTGLGLAICKQLVEQANGTIVASSNPSAKSGAMFTITLQTAPARRAKAG
jgi:two-component system NtrC family sensor kinase